MSVRFYIRSCGQSPQQGYRWVEATSGDTQLNTPNIVSRLYNLVHEEDFSMILARYEQQIVLQVTGISGKEEDYQHRNVQNTLLCIGNAQSSNDEEDEKMIRAIAVAALQLNKPLEDIIQQAVAFNDKSEVGFHISETLSDNLSELLVHDSQPTDKVNKRLDEDTEEARQQIVEELDKYKLPVTEQYQLLIVVTSEQIDYQIHSAWRCLLGTKPTEAPVQISKQTNVLEKSSATQKNNPETSSLPISKGKYTGQLVHETGPIPFEIDLKFQKEKDNTHIKGKLSVTERSPSRKQKLGIPEGAFNVTIDTKRTKNDTTYRIIFEIETKSCSIRFEGRIYDDKGMTGTYIKNNGQKEEQNYWYLNHEGGVLAALHSITRWL